MKKKVIFVGKDGRPSMKKVYSQMTNRDAQLQVRRKLKKGKTYIRQYLNNMVEKHNRLGILELDLTNSIVIRWGNRIEVPTDNRTIIYNRVEAIGNATNKKISREIFIKNKVRTPKLFTPEMEGVTFPIIARPCVHSKGKNFVIISDMYSFKKHYDQHRDNWYYSEYIDKDREFRVHCAHGKVLAVMEKPPVAGQIAWNRAINHQAFDRVKQQDYIFTVCYQALKAVNVLGLDFGGVDVIFKNGEKHKAYVLEVNTSPTLNSSEYVSARYAKYFEWLFKEEKRRDHWDYTQYENPVSFAWKENQF